MRLISVTVLSGLLTFINTVKGLLISKVVAIYAGPEGLALMGQVQSFVAGINGLVSNQIAQGITRFTAEQQDTIKASYYWRASVRLLLIILVFTAPLLILISPSMSVWLLNNGQLYWVFILAVAFLPLNICNSFLLAVVNGKEEHLRYITTLMISTVVSAILAVILIVSMGLVGGLIAVAINNGFAGIVVISRVYREEWFAIRYWFGRADKDKAVVMAKYMALGVVGALTGPVSMILIRNILTENVSLAAAGNWQLVWSVSAAFISVITTALSVYFFPKLSKIKYPQKLVSETTKVLLFIMPLTCVGAVFIYVLRELVIQVLATSEFESAAELFKVQLIGDVVRVLSFAPALLLIAKGYFKINAFCEIFASANFTVLSFFFVREYGVVGVTYAYLLNYFIYMLIVWAVFFRHLKFMGR